VTVVYLAVEGNTDVSVAERLIRHVGLIAQRAVVAGGAPRLDRRIPDLIRSAAHINWLVLRDLDREGCAPELLHRLYPRGMPARMSLRIPVRSLDSLPLADAAGFAEEFFVRRGRLPDRPDELDNPKQFLVNVCRSSRKSAIRDSVPARDGSGRTIGPEYVSRVSAFARGNWSLERAAQRSPSLARTIRALGTLARDGAWAR